MEKKRAKTGLKKREVKAGHFSSNITDKPKDVISKIVLTLIDASNLLASDIQTGTSDPVGFVWCGYPSYTTTATEQTTTKGDKAPTLIQPQWDNYHDENAGIALSKTMNSTVNPIWNEDLIFPIQINQIESIFDLKCIILIRDEDEEDISNNTLNNANANNNTNTKRYAYDNLGQVSIDLADVINDGKSIKNTIVLPMKKVILQKAMNMRKVDGYIRFKISIIFSDDDLELLMKQYKLKYSHLFHQHDEYETDEQKEEEDKITYNLENFTKLLQSLGQYNNSNNSSNSVNQNDANAISARLDSSRPSSSSSTARNNKQPSVIQSPPPATIPEEDGDLLSSSSRNGSNTTIANTNQTNKIKNPSGNQSPSPRTPKPTRMKTLVRPLTAPPPATTSNSLSGTHADSEFDLLSPEAMEKIKDANGRLAKTISSHLHYRSSEFDNKEEEEEGDEDDELNNNNRNNRNRKSKDKGKLSSTSIITNTRNMNNKINPYNNSNNDDDEYSHDLLFADIDKLHDHIDNIDDLDDSYNDINDNDDDDEIANNSFNDNTNLRHNKRKNNNRNSHTNGEVNAWKSSKKNTTTTSASKSSTGQFSTNAISEDALLDSQDEEEEVAIMSKADMDALNQNKKKAKESSAAVAMTTASASTTTLPTTTTATLPTTTAATLPTTTTATLPTTTAATLPTTTTATLPTTTATTLPTTTTATLPTTTAATLPTTTTATLPTTTTATTLPTTATATLPTTTATTLPTTTTATLPTTTTATLPTTTATTLPTTTTATLPMTTSATLPTTTATTLPSSSSAVSQVPLQIASTPQSLSVITTTEFQSPEHNPKNKNIEINLELNKSADETNSTRGMKMNSHNNNNNNKNNFSNQSILPTPESPFVLSKSLENDSIMKLYKQQQNSSLNISRSDSGDENEEGDDSSHIYSILDSPSPMNINSSSISSSIHKSNNKYKNKKALRTATSGMELFSSPVSLHATQRSRSDSSRVADEDEMNESSYDGAVARGNAITAARALKQLVLQQEKVRSVLHDLTSVTQQGFETLQTRILTLEENMHASHTDIQQQLQHNIANTTIAVSAAVATASAIKAEQYNNNSNYHHYSNQNTLKDTTQSNAIDSKNSSNNTNNNSSSRGFGATVLETRNINNVPKPITTTNIPANTTTASTSTTTTNQISDLKSFKKNAKKLQSIQHKVGNAIEIIAKLKRGGKVERIVDGLDNNSNNNDDDDEEEEDNQDKYNLGTNHQRVYDNNRNRYHDDELYDNNDMDDENDFVYRVNHLSPTTDNNSNNNNNNNNTSLPLSQQQQQQKYKQQQLKEWQHINQLLNDNNYESAIQTIINGTLNNANNNHNNSHNANNDVNSNSCGNNNKSSNNDSADERNGINHVHLSKLLAITEPNQVLSTLSNSTMNSLYQGIADALNTSAATNSNNSGTTTTNTTGGDYVKKSAKAVVISNDDDDDGHCMRWLVALTRPRLPLVLSNPKYNHNSNNNSNNSNNKMYNKNAKSTAATAAGGGGLNRPLCQGLNKQVIYNIIQSLDKTYINNNSNNNSNKNPTSTTTTTIKNSLNTTTTTNNNNDSKVKQSRAFALLLKSVLMKQLPASVD